MTLQQLGDRLIQQVQAKFNLLPDQIALTLLTYAQPSILNQKTNQKLPNWFSYRGTELIYPASVVKLFYMVALVEWLENRMVSLTPEIARALRDMIVDSSNDATSLIVDVLTGTTSGAELPEAPFQTWQYQRQIVNRYFHGLEVPAYRYINVCQKTWGDGPYGRERAFYGSDMANRNFLTTDATAHLLDSIMSGGAVNSDRCQTMQNLLKRSLKPEDLAADPENQITGFLGEGLPQGAAIWSKAGLMSKVRHDAAYIEVAEIAFTLVVFTEGHAQNQAILPFISQTLVQDINAEPI